MRLLGLVIAACGLALCHGAAQLWPADIGRRALGRSAACEMHSGFASLRGECPMDLTLEKEVELSELTHTDIRRVVALWNDLRGRFGGEGPFLLGAWSSKET